MEVLERKENARASGIKVYVQKALTIQFEQEYRNLAKKEWYMYLPPCGKRTCILQEHGEFPAAMLQNVLTQLKQHLQKFCRVQIEKMEHSFYSY